MSAASDANEQELPRPPDWTPFADHPLGDQALALLQANLVELSSLNDIDRRMLKESFRVARRLQQKMELDYQR